MKKLSHKVLRIAGMTLAVALVAAAGITLASHKTAQAAPLVSGLIAGPSVAVSGTTATVTFEVSVAPGASGTYSVEYGKTTGYGSSTSAVSVAGTTGSLVTVNSWETVTIPSLTCATTYHFQPLLVITGPSYPGTAYGGDLTGATGACPLPCSASTPGGTAAPLHGFAWSSTIGWISFNCAEVAGSPDYKVSVNPSTGAFSGYGWSSNVGWVSFNAADVSSCGAAPVLSMSTNHVTGWARILSGTAGSGADGCINLGSTGHGDGLVYSSGVPVTGGSGVLPGSQLAGFTWGGVNTGWLNFDYVTINLPSSGTVNFNARYSGSLYPGGSTPLTLPSSGGTADLVWQTASMSSCLATTSVGAPGPWTGSVPVYNPSDWTTTGTIPADVMTNSAYPLTFPANTTSSPVFYTYTLNCAPASGPSVSSTITVTVNALVTTSLPTVVTTSATGITPTSAVINGTLTSMGSVPSVVVAFAYGTTASYDSTDGAGTLSAPGNFSYELSSLTCDTTYHYEAYADGSWGYAYGGDLTFTTSSCPPVSCAVVVSSPTLSASGSSVNVSEPIGVSWTGGTFYTTSFFTSVGSGLAAALTDPATGASNITIGSSTGTLNLQVTGPMPSASVPVTISASPSTSDSGITSCTPATIDIIPSTTSTGTSGSNRPPWEEF